MRYEPFSLILFVMIGFFFKLFILFAANGLVLWIIDHHFLVENFRISDSMHSYLYVGTLVGIMNLILKPLLNLIVIPFQILLLGGSSILFNALFLFLSEKILSSYPETQTVIEVDGILTYLIIGAILAFANSVFHAFGIE